LKRAGVPQALCAPRTKPENALGEIDRLIAADVRFGVVLADAGYGLAGRARTLDPDERPGPCLGCRYAG